MSLVSGQRINRRTWTQLPMPGEVIIRVQELAKNNPAGGDVQFGWRNGTLIVDGADDEDDLHDENYVPTSDDDDNDDSVSDNEGDDGTAADDAADSGSTSSDRSTSASRSGGDSESDSESTLSPVSDANSVEDADEHSDSASSGGVPDNDNSSSEGVTGENEDTGLSAEMDEAYGVRTRSGMRPRRAPTERLFATRDEDVVECCLLAMLWSELSGESGFEEIHHIALQQYGLKRGLDIYGERAIAAVVKEMKQLHDRKTINRNTHQS